MFNFNDRFIMKRITNIIEVECENFSLDVKYWYKKLNEQEDEVDIKRVYMNSYTTQENEVIRINKRIIPNNQKLPSSWEEIIVQEISNDIENFI
jgi:hypothetical protein